MKRGLLLIALVALAAAQPALAGGPHMLVGAADDIVEQHDPAAAKAKLALATQAGLDAIRITATWRTGETTLAPEAATNVGNAVAAADAAGTRVIVSLYPYGSSVTPLTDADRADFAAWAVDVVERFPSVHDWIVGNEPNLNRFWLPQYGPDGEDAAAQGYEALLAKTYDAIKAVQPHSTVYGGALAPHGSDRPDGIRPTHSPTAFILDLGAAYKASGRQVPIMDAFALHPYEDSSQIPPTFEHPKSTSIGIADYGKLVGLLGQAFDGTAQRGSTLPILYDEYGVDTQIPADKAELYTGTEPASIHPVPEATQALYYQEALQLAFCQPTVMGLLFFHFVDERSLPAWQSGLYYVDGTAKTSLGPVENAIAETGRGVIASCPELQLTPKLKAAPKLLAGGRATLTLTASLDAHYTVTLERVGTATRRVANGTLVGATPTTLHYRLRPGRYRWTVTATAAENAGAPKTVTTRAVVVR